MTQLSVLLLWNIWGPILLAGVAILDLFIVTARVPAEYVNLLKYSRS